MLRILVTLFIYVIILAVLYLFKPNAMFDNNHQLKTIGFSDENKSLFSIYYLTPIIIILIYIITLAIWKN